MLCKIAKKCWAYLRALQGHTGGTAIAPEMMGHVLLPYRWKEFLYHEGCSFDMKSILEHGGKETKEGRRTIFFSPLNPFGKDEEAEAVHGDLSVPRKFPYSSNWKHDQDPFSCEKNFQRTRLRFWHTKSHAIVVHNIVPPDCIFNVIAKNGERTLFDGLSTPRPATIVTHRSSWQVQQQQPARHA